MTDMYVKKIRVTMFIAATKKPKYDTVMKKMQYSFDVFNGSYV